MNSHPIEKYEEYQGRVREAFELFENDGVIHGDEIGTCLRYLNLNPTQSQVKKIEEECGLDFIDYEKFESVVLKILITNTYGDEMMIRDNEDTILRAFEVLDPEKTGYIESDKLVHLLEQYGEPFNTEEIKELLNAAEDPENHMIRYEEFAHILATE